MAVSIIEILSYPVPKSSGCLIVARFEHMHFRSPISLVVFIPHNGTLTKNPSMRICTTARHCDLAQHELVPQRSILKPVINVLGTGGPSVELGGHDPQSWTPLCDKCTQVMDLDEYRNILTNKSLDRETCFLWNSPLTDIFSILYVSMDSSDRGIPEPKYF